MTEVKKPYVSPETMERMWQFFLRTSIPRIVEKQRVEEAEKLKNEDNQMNDLIPTIERGKIPVQFFHEKYPSVPKKE